MAGNATLQDLDNRIARARANISELMEQATATSGSGAEEAIANRLSEQQDVLNALLKQREELEKGAS